MGIFKVKKYPPIEIENIKINFRREFPKLTSSRSLRTCHFNLLYLFFENFE